MSLESKLQDVNNDPNSFLRKLISLIKIPVYIICFILCILSFFVACENVLTLGEGIVHKDIVDSENLFETASEEITEDIIRNAVYDIRYDEISVPEYVSQNVEEKIKESCRKYCSRIRWRALIGSLPAFIFFLYFAWIEIKYYKK